MRPDESHVERTAEFLQRLQAWAASRDDVRALVIVGSVARGDARPDSDVDVVLISTNQTWYLERIEWVADLGVAETIEIEEYGKVTSLRTRYRNGLEVEFAVATADWATAPYDPGTVEVASRGILVLSDRDGHATALARAVKS